MTVVFSNPTVRRGGIAKDGLVLHLDAGDRFSYPESGTKWNDLSGNGNHGTLVNSPTFSSGSFTFNGVDQYVDLGAKQFNTSSGTMGFWVKFTNSITTSYTGNQRPFGSNGDFEMRWNNGSGRQFIFDIGVSSPASLTSGSFDWLNTTWYNVVATWNSSTTTSSLYVNGTLNATGTTAATATLTALTGTAYIGRSTSGGYLAGQIPHFMAYNRTLSASEISQNFETLRARFGISFC